MTASTEADAPPTRIPWPPALFICALLGGRALDFLLPALPVPQPAATAVGSAVVVAALANDLWCAWTLRRSATTILPHRAVSALVTEGPYRYSRNPIYIAELALTFGVALLLRSTSIALATPLLFFALTKLAIEPEERHLAKKFGAAFERYAAKTPRWL